MIVADCGRFPPAVVPGWITGHMSMSLLNIKPRTIPAERPELVLPLHYYSGVLHVAYL